PRRLGLGDGHRTIVDVVGARDHGERVLARLDVPQLDLAGLVARVPFTVVAGGRRVDEADAARGVELDADILTADGADIGDQRAALAVRLVGLARLFTLCRRDEQVGVATRLDGDLPLVDRVEAGRHRRLAERVVAARHTEEAGIAVGREGVVRVTTLD